MITIIPYLKKPGVAEALTKVVDWLKERQVPFVLPEEEAALLGLQAAAAKNADLFAHSQFVITIGGDGTTLKAFRMMTPKLLPTLGINLGEVGFLMQVSPENIQTALEKLFTHQYHLDERSLLAVEITFADGTQSSYLALNDVALGQAEFGRLVKIDVFLNEQFFLTYAADGLVVATPTGSTAYSFSAGGPFISPKNELFVLTPICPHSLFNRSLILGPGESVRLVPKKGQSTGLAKVSIDGGTLEGVPAEVKVKLATQKFQFLNVNGLSFFATLKEKLAKWVRP